MDKNKPQSNGSNDENFMNSEKEGGWTTVQGKREKLTLLGFLLAS